MIAHTDLQIAMRNRLKTLAVCTTGLVSLSATNTGYARTVGSFYTDGFYPGMELVASGFTTPGNNGARVITRVTPTTIYCSGCTLADQANGCSYAISATVIEAEAAGRTLAVGLPAAIAYENRNFLPFIGQPYVEEQYIPGPASADTTGPGGVVTIEPMYSPRIYVPSNTGINSDGRYADAIQALFVPKTAMTLASGEILYVRGKPAPFRGQRAPSATPGWSCIPITIPCRVQTTNLI